MQIDAIYENGSIKLPKHLRFKNSRFVLHIEIPDEEVLSPTQATPNQSLKSDSSDIRDQIRAILGEDYQKLASSTFTDEKTKETWYQHLEEKYLGGH